MFSSRFLEQLYIHMEWADARVWQAVAGLDAAAPDRRLRDLLFHTHHTQRAFLQVWTKQRVEMLEADRFATLPELLAWAQPTYRDIEAFVRGVDVSQLDQPMPLPWAKYFVPQGKAPVVTTLGDTLFQLASHSTYHRGQANRRLRELGVEPPLVDYIGWVWLDRPAPAWA